MVQAILLSRSLKVSIPCRPYCIITNKRSTCRSIVILELLISWWSKLFLVMVKECLLVYIKKYTLNLVFIANGSCFSKESTIFASYNIH